MKGFIGRAAKRGSLLETAILVASSVVLWEGVEVCVHQDTDFGSCKTWKLDYVNKPCTKKLGWTVACGAVAAILALFWHVPPVANAILGFKKFIAAALSVWFVFGIGVLTFGGPFSVPSNGYFASWAGGISAWALTFDLWCGDGDDDGADRAVPTVI